MGENKEYMTHPEELGCIHISADVLASIAAGAAAEVEGISGLMNLAAKKSNARGVRLSVDEFNGTGLALEQSLPIARAFADNGIDALNISVGACETNRYTIPPSCLPEGFNADRAAAVRKMADEYTASQQ